MNLKPIKFSVDGPSNCCGILEIAGFTQEPASTYDMWGMSRKTTQIPSLKNEEAVFKRFDSDFDAYVYEYIQDDGWYDGGRYLITCSLVEEYGHTGKGQFPELLDHLLKSGWKVSARFKNSNTGNKVVALQKMLTNKYLKALRKEYGPEPDDDDNW